MAAYVHGQPFDSGDESGSAKKASAVSAETNPGDRRPVDWVLLEKTMGLIPAQIMASRLQFEGIPARARQEGAGAFGLTVGILGEGRVYVPKEFEDEARALLDQIAEEPIDWEDDWDEEA